MERIDKFLSHALNITRSEARGLLKKSAVRVNGAAVASPAQKADEQRDVIEVNGEKLCFQKFVYICLYLFHFPSFTFFLILQTPSAKLKLLLLLMIISHFS